jgi:hypothetical protein
LLQLPIDTRMIAPEGAHADDRDINRRLRTQRVPALSLDEGVFFQFPRAMANGEWANRRRS